MRQRALFNQVLNEPKRVFFAFNDRTEKIISKQLKRFIEKELSYLNRFSEKHKIVNVLARAPFAEKV